MISTALMTTTCATKRTPAMSGNKRGVPAAYLSGVPCSNSFPVDAETQRRLNLNTPYQLWVTYVFGDYDIIEGDTLTVAGEAERLINKINLWKWPDGSTHRDVFLQDLRG